MLDATLVLVLALVPADRPALDVADVEVLHGDQSTHLLTYDDAGDVSAEIVMWLDAEDRPRLDAVFPDGAYLSIADNVVESNAAAQVAARARAIDAWFRANEQHASRSEWREWALCGGHLALVAIECTTPAGALGCGIGIVGSYCHCGSLISEDIDCT